MKKYIALLLCLCLMFVFAGCKNTPENLSSTDSGITSTQTSENQESESTAEDTSTTDTSSINNSSNNSVVNNNNGSSSSSNNNGGNKNNNNNNTNTSTNTNTNNNNNSNNTDIDYSDIPLVSTEEEMIEALINHALSHDGTTFSDKKTAKDTDTVSMNNVYVNMGEDTIIEEYRELDTKVMNAINDPNSPKYLDVGYGYQAPLDDYVEKFQTLRGYRVHFFSFSTAGEEKYTLLVHITQDARTEYNNNMQNNTSTYANEIKKAINECGIYKGMLQKDAIVKINEWICKKVEYDWNKVNNGGTSNKLSDFFNRKLVTCGAYAQVFELMCRSIGIDAKSVFGITNGGYHWWNVVYFSDGSKYYFDITLNDSYIIIEGENYQKIDRALFVTSFTNGQIYAIKTVGYGELS